MLTIRGGTTVDLGVVSPSKGFYLITAAGPGSGPLVSVFAPDTGTRYYVTSENYQP